MANFFRLFAKIDLLFHELPPFFPIHAQNDAESLRGTSRVIWRRVTIDFLSIEQIAGAARSPTVAPPLPPLIFCWLYFHRTFENFNETLSDSSDSISKYLIGRHRR